jgi:hypothetical protein
MEKPNFWNVKKIVENLEKNKVVSVPFSTPSKNLKLIESVRAFCKVTVITDKKEKLLKFYYVSNS